MVWGVGWWVFGGLGRGGEERERGRGGEGERGTGGVAN